MSTAQAVGVLSILLCLLGIPISFASRAYWEAAIRDWESLGRPAQVVYCRRWKRVSTGQTIFWIVWLGYSVSVTIRSY